MSDCADRPAWVVCGGWDRLRQAAWAREPILYTMDFKKTMLHVTGLLLAIGVPVSLFSTADMMSGGKKNATPPPVAVPASLQQGASGGFSPGAAPGLNLPPNASPADYAPLPSLAEVLRFDATVEWILHRWPRVTTGLPYLQLQGYRVPLMTGANPTDVAGSLTYYFNARQQVQRITLRGATGDPSVLATILASRYNFTRRLTNDPSVVLYEAVDSSNQPVGSLKIRSAPVVKANQPYSRFEVDLVMDRAE